MLSIDSYFVPCLSIKTTQHLSHTPNIVSPTCFHSTPFRASSPKPSFVFLHGKDNYKKTTPMLFPDSISKEKYKK